MKHCFPNRLFIFDLDTIVSCIVQVINLTWI
jgi:hypothetical protein